LSETTVQKVLTPNDLGLTGSHQAGIHIPKSLAWFFPSLDETHLNPDRWLSFELPDGTVHQPRFIHYNNKLLTDSGTRDEYRLTRIVPVLVSLGSQVDGTIEFQRVLEDLYSLRITSPNVEENDGRMTITISGQWRVVRRGK